jgi:REP-associated tyrosine transposase
MTQGLRRFQQAGNFHFLTFSCFCRRPYLRRAATRHLFEESLECIRRRYAFVVIGYVVMPEHVHLLVNEPKIGTLARAMQALKLSVARKQKRTPFWQARYYDFNVWNPEKTTEKLDYMHRNPVKRGLVAHPEDWEWSSFRHYQRGCEGIVEIESFWIAARRGGEPPSQL